MAASIRGFIPVLPTPLDANDRVDIASTRLLVERLAASRVDGLWTLGTTGEMAMLSGLEKRRLLETVVEAAAGRAPVIAGVSDGSTARVRDNVTSAVAAGADAIHLMAPLGWPASQPEMRLFFETIAGECPLPVYIYENSGMAKSSVGVDTLIALARHANIVGVKDTSGDMRRFQSIRYRLSNGEDFSLMQGSDQLVYLSMKCGGDGVVVSLGSVVPDLYQALFACLNNGDDSGAQNLQRRIVGLARQVYACGNPISAIKYLLHNLDGIPYRMMHPYQPPSEIEKGALLAALRQARAKQ